MGAKLLDKFNTRVENAANVIAKISQNRDNRHPAQKRLALRNALRLDAAAQEQAQMAQIQTVLPVFCDLAEELSTAKGWAFKTEHVKSGAEIDSTTFTLRSARFDLPQNHYGEDNLFALQVNIALDNGKPEVSAMMTVQKGMEPLLEAFDAKPRIKWQDRVTFGISLKSEEQLLALLENWTALQATPDYTEEKSRLKKLQSQSLKHGFQDNPQSLRFGNWA